MKNTADSDLTEEKEDFKISIDNQSLIGSAIIRRIKICPRANCQKKNVKFDQDNWIICSECRKQYCFLCGRTVNGTKHFEKKCERYTIA